MQELATCGWRCFQGRGIHWLRHVGGHRYDGGLEDNNIVGTVQIRQTRVKPDADCAFASDLFTNVSCWPAYSSDNEETAPFGVNGRYASMHFGPGTCCCVLTRQKCGLAQLHVSVTGKYLVSKPHFRPEPVEHGDNVL